MTSSSVNTPTSCLSLLTEEIMYKVKAQTTKSSNKTEVPQGSLSGPSHFAGDGLFKALWVRVPARSQCSFETYQNVLMGLANVDGVFGSEKLIGGNKPHILFDHEVLNNASGGEGKTITTMHQHSLPLLRGGINALIDVLEAAVLEGEAFLDGVRKVAHVHFEPRPTMLDTP